MKRIPFALWLGALLSLAPCLASAQEVPAPAESAAAPSQPQQTIEDLYLKSVALRVVHEQATDLSRDSKLLALSSIREMINGKRVDTVAAISVLDYLANEGTGHRARQSQILINDFPEVRRQACNLLGQVGGTGAERVLVEVLRRDEEPMVLSEAAYSLGQIGIDRDGIASERIAEAVMRVDAVKADNNLAFAGLLALEKLAKANNGLQAPETIRAIIEISRGAYVDIVREKAAQLLIDLKSYS